MKNIFIYLWMYNMCKSYCALAINIVFVVYFMKKIIKSPTSLCVPFSNGQLICEKTQWNYFSFTKCCEKKMMFQYCIKLLLHSSGKGGRGKNTTYPWLSKRTFFSSSICFCFPFPGVKIMVEHVGNVDLHFYISYLDRKPFL